MRRSRGGFPLAFGVSSVIDLYCLNAVLGAGARGGAVGWIFNYKKTGKEMSKMMKAILFVGSVALAGFAQAATLVWTGGGADDNFSTPENWDPVQAPATGDSLTFAGETRTTPYNDLDPESYVFKDISFANTSGSAFTLSGNKLRVSSSIKGAYSTVALTESFDLDVEFTGGATIGGTVDSVKSHHFIFNKTVSGPTTTELSSTTQYSGTIKFYGPVVGFKDYYRPNGAGDIYLYGANDAFATGGFSFNQGSLHIVDASNLGTAALFRSGQGGYSTAGTLYITPTNDVTIATRIGVICPSQNDTGLTIRNETTGTCVRFTGEVYEAGTKDAAGTKLVVDGPGDGYFAGSFSKDRMAFTKNGAGTWTFGSEISACALTGTVALTAGKLVVDCTIPTHKVTVSKSTVLAGRGSFGSEDMPTTVSFAGNSKYEVGQLEDGSIAALAVTGTVELAGNVAVCYTGATPLAKGSRTCLLTFGEKTGIGQFAVGTGFAADAVFEMEANALYVVVPSDTLTWTGAASSRWNTTDENWGGTTTFKDKAPVVFPDLADEVKRTVTIPSEVKPLSVSVTAGEGHPYAFKGEGGVADAALMDFFGDVTWATPLTGILSLNILNGQFWLSGAARNAAIHVGEGGRLVLDGAFADGSVLSDFEGSVTQTVDSVISGSASLTLRSARSDLCGANTFTGGLSVGQNVQDGAGNPASTVYIRNPKALGSAGDVTIFYNSVLAPTVRIAETNRTLRIYGYNNSPKVKIPTGETFEWAGDIAVYDYPQTEIFEASGGGYFILGKSDGTSTFSVQNGREITVVGDLRLYANYQSTGNVGCRGTVHLHSTSNAWGRFIAPVGTYIMMATNALVATSPVRMLQQWNNVNYYSTLDLNGFDQTIRRLESDYNKKVKNGATLTSATPAVLTIAEDDSSVFSDVDTFFVKGCLTLRKTKAGKWTLGVQNTSGGNLEVLEGTLAITDARSFPTGRKSVFRIAEGATLELADGVEGSVAYGAQIVDGKETSLMPGVYGSQTCTVPGVKKVDWITGAGTLCIRKLLNGGDIIFVR